MSVFKIVEGLLRLRGGNNTENQANVTANHELATHDAGAITAMGAVEADVEAVKASVDAAKAVLDAINQKDLASTAKQDAIITALGTLGTQTKLEAVRLVLASLDGKDYATNAKLEECRALLSTLSGKDYATEATQAAIKTVLDTIYTALDGVEGLLTTIRDKDFATSAHQVTTHGKLDTLNAKDFATGAKQDLQKAATDTVAANIGAPGSAVATSDTGAFNAVSMLKRIAQHLGNLLTQSRDAKNSLRVSRRSERLHPDQTFIERYAAISVSSATDAPITNVTPNPNATHYPAPLIDYTVAAGRTFYLKKICFTPDDPTPGEHHFTIAFNGVKKLQYCLKVGGNNGWDAASILDSWPDGYPVPAGTVITVFVRNTSQLNTYFVRYEGMEETN